MRRADYIRVCESGWREKMITVISPEYSLKEFCQRMIGKDPMEVMNAASAEITYVRRLHREKTNQADFRSGSKGRTYCDDLQRLISVFMGSLPDDVPQEFVTAVAPLAFHLLQKCEIVGFRKLLNRPMKDVSRLTFEEATHKPNLPGVMLRKAHAFWHADQPWGFHIDFTTAEGENVEAPLRHAFGTYLRGHANMGLVENLAALASYEQQLAEWAPSLRDRSFPVSQFTVVILNVMWLVLSGRLPNDDYNGTLFQWENY